MKSRQAQVFFVVFGSFLSASPAFGAGWVFSAGYNNPIGAALGANFAYWASPLAFEIGVGRVNLADGSGGLGGDADIKYLFSQSGWGPYIEGGLALGLAGSGKGFSLGAGDPFAGGGLLYSGSSIVFYGTLDYKVRTQTIFPAAGIGVKF